MNLDGKDKITPTPFDAHEQVVRQQHTHSKEGGYEADPDFEASEFPKAVAHTEAGEPVVAKDADHEAQLKDQAKPAKAAKKGDK